MSDILGRIFEAEERAKRIVEQARKKQAEERTRVETESAERLSRARDEARELIKENARTAREKADAELSELRMQIEKDAHLAGRQNEEIVEQMVDEIVRLVILPEYENR